ncbi:hypothetical protein CL622_08445 [archaeon]|nr:hypothetical protein [archaeon]
MAFLDNSGDIILDAVLTDTGRYRLAQGDGSFKIAKFAVADDEINYGNYKSEHASGSAYYDLEILQTPVLEGFTDNGAMMKSKLLSISQNNLLYMPVLKLNTAFETKTKMNASSKNFLVTVDSATELDADDNTRTAIDSDELGVIKGFDLGAPSSYIRIDQGLDTTEISPVGGLGDTLSETQYIVEIDNRLGFITAVDAKSPKSPAFIDDDDIASYYFGIANDPGVVKKNTETGENDSKQVIQGPRGTFVQFQIAASTELTTSSYLFTKLGGSDASYLVENNNTETACAGFYYIDTMVRVTGVTTGVSLDVPVRFIKRNTNVSTGDGCV